MDPRLDQLLQSRKIPQSLLLTGASIAYLEAQAKLFAQKLLKTETDPHVDISLYAPLGKTAQYSIEQLRTFKEDVYRAPFQAERKVFILLEAERMAPVGANALLKVFEEPLLTSYILLCSESPAGILPTIRSRCQKIELKGTATECLLPEIYYEALGGLDVMKPLQLMHVADQLAAWIEEASKTHEGPEDKELSPHQKETLEKQQEAASALKGHEILQAMGEAFLIWVRDVNALQMNPPPALLTPAPYHEVLRKQAARGFQLAIEDVEDLVKRALLEQSRFQPLPSLLYRMLHA